MIAKLPRETLMRIDSIPEDEAVESYMPAKEKHSTTQELFLVKQANVSASKDKISTDIGKPKHKQGNLISNLLVVLGIIVVLLMGAILTMIALTIKV